MWAQLIGEPLKVPDIFYRFAIDFSNNISGSDASPLCGTVRLDFGQHYARLLRPSKSVRLIREIFYCNSDERMLALATRTLVSAARCRQVFGQFGNRDVYVLAVFYCAPLT